MQSGEIVIASTPQIMHRAELSFGHDEMTAMMNLSIAIQQ